MLKRTIDLLKFLRGYAGPVGDEGIRFSDYAFWIDDPRLADWIDAFKMVDQHGDKKPLTALLRSKRELPAVAREYLADLIERRMKPVPKYRPRIAVYDQSDIEIKLSLGVNAVHDYRKQGYKVDDAIAKAAQDFSIPEINTLADAYAGRRTAARRLRRKRGVPK